MTPLARQTEIALAEVPAPMASQIRRIAVMEPQTAANDEGRASKPTLLERRRRREGRRAARA